MIDQQYHSELERIIDSMSIMCAYVDENKCFQYMNDNLADWLGIDSKDIANKPVVDVVGKEAEARVSSYWQKVLAGEIVNFTDNIIFLGRGSRFVNMTYLPHYKKGKVIGFYACFQDNTDQNRTIEILKKLHSYTSNNHLTLTNKINALLELGCEAFDLPLALVSRIVSDTYIVQYAHTPNGEISPGDTFETSGTYCIHTLNANGPVAYHNAGGSEIKTHPCYINFGLESYIGSPLIVDGIRYGTLNFSGPEKSSKPFGSNDYSLIQLFSQWIGNELSRYEIEKNLNRQQQLLESMSQQGRIGAWEIDLIKNTVYWSRMTKTIHEVSEDFTPDLEGAILFYKEGYSRDRVTELFEESIVTGQSWKEELQLITNKGNEVWVSATANIEMDGNKAIRVFGSFQDIDSRVKTELELKMAKEEAELAARSKSAFLANMSHEIRTPMNGVLGMLNILKKSTLTEEQLRFVNLAANSGESLLNIINDILDFSKIEAGKFNLENIDFDLYLMLGNFSETMAFRVQEKGLEFILDFKGLKSNFVRGDSGRLTQILANLIGNAIKFTQQGEIILRASDRFSGEDKCIIDFSIEDSGIGIENDKLNSLFEKFTQADDSTTREYGGTGLGLSIVKQLCELMGGDISVSSEVGVGSKFSFSVELNKSEKSIDYTSDLDFYGYDIALISNTKTLREVAANQMNAWGVDSIQCLSYVEIIDHHQLIDTSIDIVFIDIPVSGTIKSDDIDTLINWALSNKSLIVILSTMEGCESIRGKYSDKVNAIIPKPITPHQVIKIVKMMKENPENLSDLFLSSRVSDPVSEKIILAKKRFTRILLVEDNLINQEVAKELLANIGYTVDIANNGYEAILQLKNNQRDVYDMVLMDCQMPEMDGYEATDQIRMGHAGEIYLNVPIIALTANAMKEDKQKCLDAGMDDYLSKPIDPEKLEAKITLYLAVNPIN